MAGKIPPLVTPFALVSLVLALGATNVVVNKTTHTNEGAKVTRVSSRRSDESTMDDDQKISRSSSRDGHKDEQQR